jgi:hypothetical protein
MKSIEAERMRGKVRSISKGKWQICYNSKGLRQKKYSSHFKVNTI